MFASARRALALVFDPAFRVIVVRALLLTLLLFAAALAGTEFLIFRLPVLGSPLVNQALELLAPLLFVFLVAALGAPVAAFFGALFVDRLAGRIEARDYPLDPPARPESFAVTLKAGLRLAAMVLGADVLLLPLDIGLPGVGELVSLLVNGWFLGWEFFELAALRHLTVGEAEGIRKSYAGPIWLGGMLISLMSVVPGLDLLAPLFGTALMVHLFKQVQKAAS
jgi:CysZ protein